VRKASLRLLYCFFRGTLSPSFTPCKGDNISQREPVPSVSYADISPHSGESPSFTPCKGDNIPLDPRNAAFGGFLYFLKVNAVALL
ncbi:MAG: hypothetical protein K6B38_13145, partial [Ruminococcus sp.]|nr:hypothetical protein [Ruminococcus sp.]